MAGSLNKKLNGFQLIAQEKLQAILCSIPGKKKDLIIESDLIKPLEHICSASWLRLKGIQRIFKFDRENAISRTDQVQIFMLRSRNSNIQSALKSIRLIENSLVNQQSDTELAIKYYHIICVPSCFSTFHQLVESEGLYGIVALHQYNFDFINIDDGVLSLELTDVFSSLYLHRDTSFLPAIARSLRVLQMVCGQPEMILTYGENAENIMKMLKTLGDWKPKSSTDQRAGNDFSTFVILDRQMDYASALLTPAIYAGLLQEVFHNNGGEMKLISGCNKIRAQKLDLFYLEPNKVVETKAGSAEKPQILRMSSLNDEIYNENRYKHFAQASSMIRAQAKAIGVEVQKLGEMKLDEMHEYVARKLPKITELKSKILRHMKACEIVIEMMASNFRKLQSLEEDILNNNSYKRIFSEIDELLATDGQKYNSLRLLCLLHFCVGVSAEDSAQFIRNYCNMFGYDKLEVFPLLAKAGLLPLLNSPTEATSVSKKISGSSATKLLSNISIPKTFHQTPFQANANRLRLLLTTTDESNSSSDRASSVDKNPSPDIACPSYVFNGLFIPLVAQICNFLVKAINCEDLNSKFASIEGLKLTIPRSSFGNEPISIKTYCDAIKQKELMDIFPIRKKGSIFVFVVGGMSYAEIAACNLIERLSGTQIIVASDSIIAGSDLMESAFR